MKINLNACQEIILIILIFLNAVSLKADGFPFGIKENMTKREIVDILSKKRIFQLNKPLTKGENGLSTISYTITSDELQFNGERMEDLIVIWRGEEFYGLRIMSKLMPGKATAFNRVNKIKEFFSEQGSVILKDNSLNVIEPEQVKVIFKGKILMTIGVASIPWVTRPSGPLVPQYLPYVSYLVESVVEKDAKQQDAIEEKARKKAVDLLR
jgi:hypothetical protein